MVGAGAAGLMAGCVAADGGASVTVLDHNEKAGKKIYITGKGRCNYTNACDTPDFFRHVLRNPKFLYSAVYGFDAAAMTQFLRENGCPVREERGQRCFPASEKAYDVTDALVRHLRAGGGRIRLNCGVKRILTENAGCEPAAQESPPGRRKADSAESMRRAVGVQLAGGKELPADAVIVAAGGMSYPSTGSAGDGYRFARELGLVVNEPQPSLVPLVTEEIWPASLQGLSLKNVAIRVEEFTDASAGSNSDAGTTGGNISSERVFSAASAAAAESASDLSPKDAQAAAPDTRRRRSGMKKSGPIYEGFGEMLFTHFGVSGPLILSASCHTDFMRHPEGYLLHLDLKPAMTREEVEMRLKREFAAAPGKELRNVLRALLPQRLAEIAADLAAQQAGKDPSAPVRTWNEKEIRSLAGFLKDVTMHLTGTRGFGEAIITRGGVDVRQINPSTMETKSIRGLYWAGEVLDVDAYTGGFNLQIAWSTGHLAGKSAAAW